MVKRALLVIGVSFSLVVSNIGGFVANAADDYDYSLSTTLTIAEGYGSTVETVVKAEQVREGASAPSSITLPIYGQNPKAVAAVLNNGQKIDVSLTDDGARLALNTLQGNPQEEWTLTLEYSSSVVIAIGSSYIAMLPNGGYDESLTISSETREIIAAPELGSFVTRGSQPTETSSVVGERVTTWENKTGPLAQSVGVLFGNNTLADLSFNTTLSNDGWWWKTQSIVLPPDTNQQQVFIDSISPEPRSIRLDEDGNGIAEYLLRPKQTIEVSAKIRAVVSSYIYSVEDSLLLNDIDPLLTERYTSLNERWIDSSLEFEDVDTRPVAEVVEEVYDSISKEYAENQSDDPYEASVARSNTLVGELRANGIPARVILGVVYGDGSDIILDAVEHAWAEAYIPGVGWMSLDPAFEQNGDYFGVADIQRVALSIRGINSDFPPRSADNFVIGFSSEEPPTAPIMTPTISSTKYMFFPGITLNSTTVSMPAGVIVDGAGLAIGQDEVVPLGSLAPLQEVTVRSSSFLAEAFTSESVQYGIFGQTAEVTDASVITQIESSVSYLPMLFLVLAMVALYILKIVIAKCARWISARRANRKSSKPKKKLETKSGAYDDLGDDTELLLSDIKTTASDDEANQEVSQSIQSKEPTSPQQTTPTTPNSDTIQSSSGVKLSNQNMIRTEFEKKHPHKRRPPLIQ